MPTMVNHKAWLPTSSAHPNRHSKTTATVLSPGTYRKALSIIVRPTFFIGPPKGIINYMDADLLMGTIYFFAFERSHAVHVEPIEPGAG